MEQVPEPRHGKPRRGIKTAKIFVVDDNPTNVTVLEAILKKEGYTNVVSTTDSRTVVASHLAERYDLILLDIQMPHMSGIEVMQALAGEIVDDYLPILVLTAQTDTETHKSALSAGAKDFLTKPFQRWEVVQCIRNLLETRIFYKAQRIRADVLEEKVRERTEEIRATQLEIVRRLGRAGEFRDNETGAHVIRMSKMSQLLAVAAGLGEKHAEIILFASPMHDVGKIGIPDRVLLKNGKLEAAEWEIMKKHAEMGAEIIGDHNSELLRLAALIAKTHHEKWDGTGYPRGLKGEEIPVEARIVSICDVFDALTSRRPYKEPWTVEAAAKFINDQAGSHFEPAMVEVFNRILPAVAALKTEFPDEDEAEAAD